jgi:hypothetical protein
MSSEPTKDKIELASEKSTDHSESRTSKEEKVNGKETVQPNGIDIEEGEQHGWGRLVVDPEEAKIEFGEERAAKLKKTPDGKWILWPQP